MRILAVIIILLFVMDVRAQQRSVQDTTIFNAVEVMPAFPGGMQNFYGFLADHLVYPPEAIKNNIQGKVYLKMTVEPNGSLTGITVIKGVSPDLDGEAIRVLKLSPKWAPGIQNGRAVRVNFALPITFVNNTKNIIDSAKKSPDEPVQEDSVYSKLDVLPGYKGGIERFYNMIARVFKYPDAAKRNNITGRVIITFIVEKDGQLSHVTPLRGPSLDIIKEAVRAISASPKWIPGQVNGKPVRAQFTVPLMFSLNQQQ